MIRPTHKDFKTKRRVLYRPKWKRRDKAPIEPNDRGFLKAENFELMSFVQYDGELIGKLTYHVDLEWEDVKSTVTVPSVSATYQPTEPVKKETRMAERRKRL